MVQRLRHAPVGQANELFPSALLKEVHEFNRDHWHNSAILHVAGLAANPKGSAPAAKPQPSHASRNAKKAADGSNKFVRFDDLPPSPPLVPAPVPSTCSPLPPSVFPLEDPAAGNLPAGFYDELKRLEGLRALQDALPVGGRLRFFWRLWRELGASKRICRWFRKGYTLPFQPDGFEAASRWLSQSSPRFLMPDYAHEPEKKAALLLMIDDLLDKQAIVPLPTDSWAFFNRVFLIPKKTGGFRLILDVSKLNDYLAVKSFSMDTVQVIRGAVEPGMWGVSIDLSDAYHHIPVAERHTHFLAFQVGSQKYKYVVCPFGLSPIPQVFTAALSPLKLYARKQWHAPVFQYIDDWLLLARSAAEAASLSISFTETCLRLGLLVNLQKSQLLPVQRLEHLGVDWDLRLAVVRPSAQKVNALVVHLESLLSTLRAPLPLLESIRGQMVAMEKLVRFGRINFRLFQAVVSSALKAGRNHRWVRLPPAVLPNLLWWSQGERLLQGVPAVPPKPVVQVATDASHAGWGASLQGEQVRGTWSSLEAHLHINALELLAVLKTVEAWGSQWRGQPVRFLMDNRTAVAYLCKQGGTKSRSSTVIAERLFRVAESLDLSLSAVYLPGERNVLADMLSRAGQILKTEWRLGVRTFQWVCSRSHFGAPTVDLFANMKNFQLSRYMSPCPDKEAVAIDALTAPWPSEVLYAFPPPTILDRVLIKLHQERPQRLVLVAPLLTVAAWYPTLRAHARWVQLIPKEMLVLQQPHWNYVHPQPELLCLAVWCITWKGCQAEGIPPR